MVFKGPKGDTGPQGLKVNTGDVGPKGLTGDTGLQGHKGDTGNTGGSGSVVTKVGDFEMLRVWAIKMDYNVFLSFELELGWEYCDGSNGTPLFSLSPPQQQSNYMYILIVFTGKSMDKRNNYSISFRSDGRE